MASTNGEKTKRRKPNTVNAGLSRSRRYDEGGKLKIKTKRK